MIEVCKDMIPFLIVLFLSVVGFSVSYMALPENDEFSMIDSVKHNYRLMFGDFDLQDDISNSGWILFVVSSCLMTLVMLNMLIAIMSDTYARVMGDIVPSDYAELNDMILEEELMLFRKRNSGTP